MYYYVVQAVDDMLLWSSLCRTIANCSLCSGKIKINQVQQYSH